MDAELNPEPREFDRTHFMRKIALQAKLMAARSVMRHKPIFTVGERFPGITVVTRREDVLDVLERDREFSVAPYGVKIRSCLGSPTALGMLDGPEYRRELDVLHRVLQPTDLANISARTYDKALDLLRQGVRHKPSLDVVSELCDPLALHYIESYYGLSDPGHGILLRWLRMMSYYIFQCYLGTGPRIEIPAVRAAQSLLSHARSDLVARRARPDSERPDDILERLLRIQAEPDSGLDDSQLISIFVSMVSGGFNAPFWLAVNVIDRLLDLSPDELDSARQAARHGRNDVLLEYVVEAGRFYPAPVVVWRYCEQDAVLAEGTPRETRIPEGRLLALYLLTANNDPEGVPEPQTFRPGRPRAESLLFGHSLHHCPGDGIGLALITQIVRALLMQPLLRRRAGFEGLKQFGARSEFPAGKYPARLVVEVCR